MRGNVAGFGEPAAERLEPVVGQLVVGALAGDARFLPGVEVAEPFEALRLGVGLALGARPVQRVAPHHPHEVVRACTAATDEREDDVREGGQLT